MAAPMSLGRGLSRLQTWCRRDGMCRRYAKTKTSVKPKKVIIREPEPWEDRPKGLIILKEHAPFIFKFEDAVNMHKEAAQPAMANNMQGHIYADILLDFTSNKVTKPMKHYIDCLHFPHKFNYDQEYQFMVFSGSEETLDVAKSLNINLCGGMDFIEKFLAGQVHRDDIAMTDYVLATPDIYPKMAKLRNILKTKFPKTGTDQIGKDLQVMVNRMTTGVKLSTQVNVIDEVTSRVQVPFGQLEQPVDDLAQNFDYLAQHLFNKKPSEKLASHIQEVILIAPPSQERFTLNMNYITRKPAEVKGKRAKTEDNKADLEEDSDMEDEKSEDKNIDELSDNEDDKR